VCGTWFGVSDYFLILCYSSFGTGWLYGRRSVPFRITRKPSQIQFETNLNCEVLSERDVNLCLFHR